jgi:cyclophilin family peptidyl-prolyl cis-trans isomerase
MAKSARQRGGTSGSQFFIVIGAQGTTIGPDYALVGTVTGGLDVVQRIGALSPPSRDGAPTTPVYIRAITITVT